MNNIYLVDFENVHYEGIENLKHLDEKDKVVIFYSKQQQMKKKTIEDSRATIVTIEAYSGKNALDFQLAAYLGIISEKEKEKKEYYIVSKDKGYAPLISFFKNIVSVNLIPKIMVDIEGETPEKKKKKKKTQEGITPKEELKILTNNLEAVSFTKEDIDFISDLEKTNKLTEKRLQKKFGKKKTKEIMRVVKERVNSCKTKEVFKNYLIGNLVIHTLSYEETIKFLSESKNEKSVYQKKVRELVRKKEGKAYSERFLRETKGYLKYF